MSLSFDLKRAAVAFIAAAFACSLALTGCSQQLAQQSSAEEEIGPTSRSFMADMNEAAADLSEKMQAFTDAVAREDLVSMRVQADAAFSALDQMSRIEAPDEVSDLKQRYVDGCTQLKDALSAYLDLYSEIDASTTRNPFDYDGYADRLAEIQSQYDAGVQALEDADKAATEM